MQLIILDLCGSLLTHFSDMLFAPWSLAFDFFSSDLDILAQGQAMIVLFIRMHFTAIFLKSTKEILMKNLHRKIAK